MELCKYREQPKLVGYSPNTITSTRLLSFRLVGESLLNFGRVEPKPLAMILVGSIPLSTKNLATFAARAPDSSQLEDQFFGSESFV